MFHQQLGVGAGSMPDSAASASTAPLEDRLRSVILTNSDANGIFTTSPGSAAKSAIPPPSSYGQPPPSQGAASPTSMTTVPPAQAPASPKSARRRLNQAQRRQMSAQLSIPIDPRPTPHSAGHYVSPTAYGNTSQFQHSHQHQSHNQYYNHNHSHHNQQRPQSATLRPSYYGHGPGPQGMAAPSYPSQPRHQQSLSYQGPVGYDDPFDWRSQQAHQPPFSPYEASSPRSARLHSNQHSSHSSQHSNQHSGRAYYSKTEDIQSQAALLEQLCEKIVASAEIEPAEIQEKENFRARIERLCQAALTKYELEVNNRQGFPPLSIQLKCFGSLSSGFATKASDMDLGLISPLSQPLPDAPKSPVPRLIEKAFLDAGLGARLLTRTRVSIIKLCESPPEQLLVDLLDERARWERGLLPDHDGPEVEEEVVDEPDTAQAHHEEGNADEAKPRQIRKESICDEEPLKEDKYGHALTHLKQPVNQNIGNYYAATKRLLRKLGGRDIAHSTAREFKNSDLKVLTDVCHAFVVGLTDETLKDRLLATRSLATSHTPTPLNYRSLYGVFMQAEGEALVMLWNTREITEKDVHHENEALQKIRAWKDLQNKPAFYQDLLGYNKELQLAVEGLRKIVSLQIMTLEQGQFESPAQYHDRTAKLLFQSGGRDTASPGNTILQIVIKHYIAGIWSHEIRAQVNDFLQTIDKPSLRAVARRHKSLQLALEFEKALAKNLYNSMDAKMIQEYIEVLRKPLVKCDLPGRRFDYVVARTPETAPVISLARQLADPSKLAPNQPRDPYKDRLEFPKTGAGVQCDINFSAHLALQNSLLLRCYSHTDPRVRPLVLFIKHWAKMRGINTPYRGTLSSYGYVLMVLHYLVNIAQPFVCPNLQLLAKPVPPYLSPEEIEETVSLRGRDIRFWRDEAEIKELASRGLLNQNKDSVGHLLRGFFEYYAQNNFMSTVPCRGFDWGRDVLSLRTQGGLRSKQAKGWTGARTVLEVQNQAAPLPPLPPASDAAVGAPPPLPSNSTDDKMDAVGNRQPSPGVQDGAVNKSPVTAPAVEMKEVKHRYLFAIEDPFELDHNVARTVTHSGIVAIRDEFRRAWRIIKSLGKAVADEDLLEDVSDHKAKDRDVFSELLNEIHGPELALR